MKRIANELGIQIQKNPKRKKTDFPPNPTPKIKRLEVINELQKLTGLEELPEKVIPDEERLIEPKQPDEGSEPEIVPNEPIVPIDVPGNIIQDLLPREWIQESLTKLFTKKSNKIITMAEITPVPLAVGNNNDTTTQLIEPEIGGVQAEVDELLKSKRKVVKHKTKLIKMMNSISKRKTAIFANTKIVLKKNIQIMRPSLLHEDAEVAEVRPSSTSRSKSKNKNTNGERKARIQMSSTALNVPPVKPARKKIAMKSRYD